MISDRSSLVFRQQVKLAIEALKSGRKKEIEEAHKVWRMALKVANKSLYRESVFRHNEDVIEEYMRLAREVGSVQPNPSNHYLGARVLAREFLRRIETGEDYEETWWAFAKTYLKLTISDQKEIYSICDPLVKKGIDAYFGKP